MSGRKLFVCMGCGRLIRPEKLKWSEHNGVFTAFTGNDVYYGNKKYVFSGRKKALISDKNRLAVDAKKEKEMSWLEKYFGNVYRNSRRLSALMVVLYLILLAGSVFTVLQPEPIGVAAGILGIFLFGFGLVLFASRLIYRQRSE